MLVENRTNQIFPIIPDAVLESWEKNMDIAIRSVWMKLTAR